MLELQKLHQPSVSGPAPLLRAVYGTVLRRERLRQRRTLDDVATRAGVSIQYLSEIERGLKEASSEILAAVCTSLGSGLAAFLAAAHRELAAAERRPVLDLARSVPPGPVPPAGFGPGVGPELEREPEPDTGSVPDAVAGAGPASREEPVLASEPEGVSAPGLASEPRAVSAPGQASEPWGVAEPGLASEPGGAAEPGQSARPVLSPSYILMAA